MKFRRESFILLFIKFNIIPTIFYTITVINIELISCNVLKSIPTCVIVNKELKIKIRL